MSNSKVRKETRFLTDKMAYELNLNTEQYNDVYEINYDFISGIRYLMDDVLRGEEWALNRYYDYLMCAMTIFDGAEPPGSMAVSCRPPIFTVRFM